MQGIGVLLINLGTPDSAEPKAVRKYLAEFLSDRRVVEIPQIAWQPLLRGIILKGAGLSPYVEQIVLLAVFAAATLALASVRMSRREA